MVGLECLQEWYILVVDKYEKVWYKENMVEGAIQTTEPTGEIIVTLASKELKYSYEQLGVTFDSSDSEILDALQPVVLEEEGFDIKEEQDEGAYTLKRVDQSKNIYLFPKSTAG